MIQSVSDIMIMTDNYTLKKYPRLGLGYVLSANEVSDVYSIVFTDFEIVVWGVSNNLTTDHFSKEKATNIKYFTQIYYGDLAFPKLSLWKLKFFSHGKLIDQPINRTFRTFVSSCNILEKELKPADGVSYFYITDITGRWIFDPHHVIKDLIGTQYDHSVTPADLWYPAGSTAHEYPAEQREVDSTRVETVIKEKSTAVMDTPKVPIGLNEDSINSIASNKNEEQSLTNGIPNKIQKYFDNLRSDLDKNCITLGEFWYQFMLPAKERDIKAFGTILSEARILLEENKTYWNCLDIQNLSFIDELKLRLIVDPPLASENKILLHILSSRESKYIMGYALGLEKHWMIGCNITSTLADINYKHLDYLVYCLFMKGLYKCKILNIKIDISLAGEIFTQFDFDRLIAM